MSITSYRDLEVWKKSVALVTTIYQVTAKFPKEEIYGLTSQIRRSAVSIPSNIAEGRGKRSTRDFIRYLNISYGSVCELETQLVIAGNLQLLDVVSVENILESISEIARMLNGLISSLELKLSSPESRMQNAESYGT
ncbi:MAG: four helix bundle protein [Rickettsiales bacterium]